MMKRVLLMTSLLLGFGLTCIAQEEGDLVGFDHDLYGDEEAAPGRMPASSQHLGQVTGRTQGVDGGLLTILREAAARHQVHIHVTSGKRDTVAQGRAMYDNWEKLKRGGVYKPSALPPDVRNELNRIYDASRSLALDEAGQRAARDRFIKMAGDQVGSKSKHATGKAVDVARAPLNESAIRELRQRLREVPEGNRTDILHLEVKP